jgi:hypothetical protein
MATVGKRITLRTAEAVFEGTVVDVGTGPAQGTVYVRWDAGELGDEAGAGCSWVDLNWANVSVRGRS